MVLLWGVAFSGLCKVIWIWVLSAPFMFGVMLKLMSFGSQGQMKFL